MGLLLLLKPGDVVEIGQGEGQPPITMRLLEKSGQRSRVEIFAEKSLPVKTIRVQ